MVIKTRKKKEIQDDTKAKLVESGSIESIEDAAMRGAEAVTKTYEDNQDKVTERPVEKFEDDRVSQAEDLKEKIEKNEHTKEDVPRLEYVSSVIMSALTLNEMSKVLRSAGYSNKEIREILEENYRRGEDAYVQARMQGKSDEEAREAARKAQVKYLSTIHASMDKKHRKGFEKAVGNMLGQQEVGALALASGKEDAIDAAFNATDVNSQKAVVKEYGLMKDFKVDAFFGALSAVFTAAAVAGALSGAGEAEEASPGEKGMEILDFCLQEEQKAKDETEALASMDEAIEELMEADREKGESSEGEEPTVADLNEETQDALEKFGVSTEATVKEALEVMENARESARERMEAAKEQAEHVSALRTSEVDLEVPPGSENYLPPFYPRDEAVKKLEDRAEAIRESDDFMARTYVEYWGDDKLHAGTAFTALNGKMDRSDEKSPEYVVAQYLLNPADNELKEEFERIMGDPANVAIRAAVLEAAVRASEKVLEARKEE